MRCSDARSWLLDADLERVTALTALDGPEAEHFGTCPACRTAAKTLVADTRDLANALEACTRGAPNVDAILAAASTTPSCNAGGEDAVSDDAVPSDRSVDSDPGRSARRRLGVLALAAAAGLGALLLLERPEPELPGALLAFDAGSPDAGIELATRANAAVLATSDPTITVIWFYE